MANTRKNLASRLDAAVLTAKVLASQGASVEVMDNRVTIVRNRQTRAMAYQSVAYAIDQVNEFARSVESVHGPVFVSDVRDLETGDPMHETLFEDLKFTAIMIELNLWDQKTDLRDLLVHSYLHAHNLLDPLDWTARLMDAPWRFDGLAYPDNLLTIVEFVKRGGTLPPSKDEIQNHTREIENHEHTRTIRPIETEGQREEPGPDPELTPEQKRRVWDSGGVRVIG